MQASPSSRPRDHLLEWRSNKPSGKSQSTASHRPEHTYTADAPALWQGSGKATHQGPCWCRRRQPRSLRARAPPPIPPTPMAGPLTALAPPPTKPMSSAAVVPVATHLRTHANTYTHTHTHTNTRTHEHAHTRARTHASTHTRTRTRAHTETHAQTRTHTHTHAHKRAHTHAHKRAHTHKRTHTHTSAAAGSALLLRPCTVIEQLPPRALGRAHPLPQQPPPVPPVGSRPSSIARVGGHARRWWGWCRWRLRWRWRQLAGGSGLGSRALPRGGSGPGGAAVADLAPGRLLDDVHGRSYERRPLSHEPRRPRSCPPAVLPLAPALLLVQGTHPHTASANLLTS